jgi:hypothetical protein
MLTYVLAGLSDIASYAHGFDAPRVQDIVTDDAPASALLVASTSVPALPVATVYVEVWAAVALTASPFVARTSTTN